MAASADRPTRVSSDLFDNAVSEVQARLEARLRTTDLGAVLAARGATTVALNEQGELTEYRADGTSASV